MIILIAIQGAAIGFKPIDTVAMNVYNIAHKEYAGMIPTYETCRSAC